MKPSTFDDFVVLTVERSEESDIVMRAVRSKSVFLQEIIENQYKTYTRGRKRFKGTQRNQYHIFI
jgi:uncharacterized protein YijF (DUF1287 family)